MFYSDEWYEAVKWAEIDLRGVDPGPWTDAQEQYLEWAYAEGLTPQQAAEGICGLRGDEADAKS